MMEHSKRLDDWLAAARADLSKRTPDLLAEQRLISCVREIRALQSIAAARADAPPPRRDRRFRLRPFGWLAPAFAVMATLAIGIGIVLLEPSVPDRSAKVRTPFFALVGSDALAAEPSAIVVSSQVSGAALADYGLPVDPARVDQPIEAEFLLSPFGMVLAVRFSE